ASPGITNSLRVDCRVRRNLVDVYVVSGSSFARSVGRCGRLSTCLCGGTNPRVLGDVLAPKRCTRAKRGGARQSIAGDSIGAIGGEFALLLHASTGSSSDTNDLCSFTSIDLVALSATAIVRSWNSRSLTITQHEGR